MYIIQYIYIYTYYIYISTLDSLKQGLKISSLIQNYSLRSFFSSHPSFPSNLNFNLSNVKIPSFKIPSQMISVNDPQPPPPPPLKGQWFNKKKTRPEKKKTEPGSKMTQRIRRKRTASHLIASHSPSTPQEVIVECSEAGMEPPAAYS